MKLQLLTASAFVLVGLSSLACSAPDDDIFMGGDGSGGSSAGTKSSGSAGTGTGASESGGTGSGGSSSNAGTGTGGSSSAGTGTAGTGMGGSSSNGGTGSGGYEPCAGKACGDFCSPCDPKDANCVAPAVDMTCTATGQCSIGRPACTIPSCEGSQTYYAPGCNSLAKPAPGGGTPFTAGCYDACSAAGSCPDGFSCVGVWHDPSASCAPGDACIAACGSTADICVKG